MSPRRSDPLFIGVGGHVVAIDPGTGEELWRSKLKGAAYVTVLPMATRVMAGAGGELFCLDARTGELLWRNKLRGLGLGLVSFAGGDPAIAAAMMQQAQQAAVTAAS